MGESMRGRARAGFTLIELLVVILILGILAALIVPKVVGRTADARIAAAKSDLAELGKQLETFRVDMKRYPTTEEGLQALRVAPADGAGWKGPYLTKDVPNDPWGNPYMYEYPGQGGTDSFVLMSYGSDGQPGGDGEAADLDGNH